MTLETKPAPSALLQRVLKESAAVGFAMADDALALVITFPKFHVEVRTAGEPVVSDEVRQVPDTNPIGHAVSELLTEGLSLLPKEALSATMGLIQGGHGRIEIRVDLLFAIVTAEFVNALDGGRLTLFTLKVQETYQ